MKSYFLDLNYTLANEDTRVELDVARQLPSRRHFVCIAGSGARVIPLFAAAPQRLTVVDVSPAQLMLTELRVESLRSLCLNDYAALLGYPFTNQNLQYKRSLVDKLDLNAQTRSFAHALLLDPRPIIYRGRFEKSLCRMAAAGRFLCDRQLDELFACHSLEEQRLFLRNGFPWRRFSGLCAVLGSRRVLDALLYRGDCPPTSSIGHDFYLNRFRNVLEQTLVRDNFFLQMLFLGRIRFESGLPLEVNHKLYKAMQQGARRCRIDYRQAGLDVALADVEPQSVDFISASDVPSYTNDDEARRLALWCQSRLSSFGSLVARSYRRRVDLSTTELIANEDDSVRAVDDVVGVYDVAIYQPRKNEAQRFRMPRNRRSKTFRIRDAA